jgi:ketosteroid isomerase-like protein
MSQKNVETVRRGYELFAAGDLDGASVLFSADAEVGDAGGLGVAGTTAGTRHGVEGFPRSTEEPLDAFENYRVEAEDFIVAGEAVVVRFGSPVEGGQAGCSWRRALHTYGCSPATPK